MVTNSDLKKSLGSKADNLSEEQLTELNLLLERISDALFNSWVKKTSMSIDEKL